MKQIIAISITISFLFINCNNRDTTTTASSSKNKNLQLVKPILQTIAKYPDSIGLRLQLINVLDSLQLYPEAIKQIDSLTKKDSTNYGLWYRKGKLMENAKDTFEAINSYTKALKIYPAPDGMLSLANLLAEKRNIQALSICNAVLNLRMGREYDAHSYFISGVYFARTGNTKKAQQLFDECISNNYSYLEAYLEKGFIFFDAKNYDAALKIFKLAASINNTYPDAYYWMAKCFEAENNKQEALKNYQIAFQLDNTLQEAGDAIKRLQ